METSNIMFFTNNIKKCNDCKKYAVYINPSNYDNYYCTEHKTQNSRLILTLCQTKNCGRKSVIESKVERYCFKHIPTKKMRKNTICVYKRCQDIRQKNSILCSKHLFISYRIRDKKIKWVNPRCLSGFICAELTCLKNAIYTFKGSLIPFCDDHKNYLASYKEIHKCTSCNMPCIEYNKMCTLCSILHNKSIETIQ
jgi:hypothetical protein